MHSKLEKELELLFSIHKAVNNTVVDGRNAANLVEMLGYLTKRITKLEKKDAKAKERLGLERYGTGCFGRTVDEELDRMLNRKKAAKPLTRAEFLARMEKKMGVSFNPDELEAASLVKAINR